MEKPEKGDISFEYRISANYSVYAVSGVVGGLSPGGEIIASFFNERSPIPKKVKHKIDEDGKLGEVIEKEIVDSIIRNVMFGLSMNPRVAKAVGKWLIQKAEEYEAIFSQKKEGLLSV